MGRNRETYIQSNIQADRQTYAHTSRQTYTHTVTYTDNHIQAGRQANWSHTYILTYIIIQAERHTDNQRPPKVHTESHTDTGNNTYRRAYTHRGMHTHTGSQEYTQTKPHTEHTHIHTAIQRDRQTD